MSSIWSLTEDISPHEVCAKKGYQAVLPAANRLNKLQMDETPFRLLLPRKINRPSSDRNRPTRDSCLGRLEMHSIVQNIFALRAFSRHGKCKEMSTISPGVFFVGTSFCDVLRSGAGRGKNSPCQKSKIFLANPSPVRKFFTFFLPWRGIGSFWQGICTFW